MRLVSIFDSLQGEGRFQGYPSAFVRLYGCNLRCRYCDTQNSLDGGNYFEKSPSEIAGDINSNGIYDLCITGGEPLCQRDELSELLRLLKGKRIDIETNGSVDVSPVFEDFRAHNTSSEIYFSIDWKCPGSGNPVFDPKNIGFLKKSGTGWLKFVVADEADLRFAEEKLPLLEGIETFISPVFGEGKSFKGAADFVRNHNNVRLQLQLHKILGIE